MEDTRAVANFFIEKAKEEKFSLDQMKLQKLLYYAYGWYWGYHDKPLFNETIEAWDYGPVVRSIYQEFRGVGRKAITKTIEPNWFEELDNIEIPPIKQEIAPFLEAVWDAYKDYSDVYLSKKTHEEGTPWDTVVKRCYSEYGGLPRNIDIPNESIKDHFKSKITTNS